MIKRVITALLVICFLSFAAAPNVTFAGSGSDETSADGRMIAGGLLLIAGLLWLASDSNDQASLEKENKFANNKTKAPPKISKKSDKGIDMGLNFAKAGYIPEAKGEPFSKSEDEWQSPELKVGFTW